ncbi:MAG: 50S ribosomal protein L17 [Candidatus Fraserbacteria bacterium RBG_16_55_9]|uniref:Large ribosomal subunit protein bL17 n=1 Tax=Fraserbacteria sp. (strain RBG_16_55_9) TaxID=1817864 RepID=A0A1F5UPD4_FRAXR|nr:MAG: 50S ribosomal protein L17 [Candidatus Fraserbacteria bacterium RBG_16_55_9]
MRHRKKFRKLNRTASHRKLMLASQVKALIAHGKVDTTVTRAKESRIMAEKLITWAKQGDVHARRQVFRVLQDKDIIKKLFDEIGPRYQDRQGGYTRVLKLPPRLGDGAEMARLTWV